MIIGIAGTNGAGKGTIVEYLIEKHTEFKHYSVREFLIEEIKRRELPINRSSMRDVANDLRRQHGPSYVIETLYARAADDEGSAVLESVRVPNEAAFIKQRGAQLWAVDADREVRYKRIVERSSETDKVDFDTWVKEEEREWKNVNPWDMDVLGVMDMADHTFKNNGAREELYAQIENALEQLKK